MSNTIKYSTQTENNTLKKGNFVIGVNDVDYGPTSETGYHNTITPPEGGYVVYKNRGDNERSIYVAQNDEELVTLKDDFGATGSTANDVLVWAAQQDDVLILNNPLDNIVTDGLVLYLDAGFTCSYPKSNTTWYDLSGNGNGGTLTNGPTFSDGSLVFDGSDDVINLPSSNDLTGNNLQNMTVEIWLKYTDTGIMYSFSLKRSSIISTLLSITCNQDVNTSTGRLGFLVRNYADTAHEWITHNGGYNDGNWHHVCGVIDGTNRILYIDGSQKNSSTGGIQSVSSNTAIATIGAFSAGNTSFNGNISNARFYRKSLTSSEVLQNYNAQKSRFGL